MPVYRSDGWVRIAELRDGDQIYFTKEFLEVVGGLGPKAKAFVGHLLGLWYEPFGRLLDYSSGESMQTPDQPGEFARNDLYGPQDVVEHWPRKWAQRRIEPSPHESGLELPGLGPEWYRDAMRAKLVTLALPRRLLEEYVNAYLHRKSAASQ